MTDTGTKTPALEGSERREAEDDGDDVTDARATAGRDSSPPPPPADPAAAPRAATTKGDTSDPLIPRGNRLRGLRGGLTAAVGALLAFLLMANKGQLRLGVPLGFLCCAIATWGVMDLLGTFDDPEERVASRTSLGKVAIPFASVLATGLLFCLALGLASSGRLLPQLGWGVVVTLTFLSLVASVFALGVRLGPWATDENGEERPLLRRHGFWVVAAGALLYFPMMGSYSLWDPWETHYGEVAREVLARDDWVSLWWAQDGWFWSKPILNFWLQAIAMATLGVHYKPDEMLVGSDPHAMPNAWPEWAVRAPIVLLTIVGMYLLYKGVSKAFGRRAGLLGGLVLATMPYWYFLAHQTMTDMACIAPMTAAMGLLLLGIRSEQEAKCRVYEVAVGKSRWRLSGWHLVFGAILACAIPQILYLFSRNLEFIPPFKGGEWGFRPHWDEFRSGSAGNCGLPGNEQCAVAHSAMIPKSLAATPNAGGALRLFGAFEPMVQGMMWLLILGFVLYLNWGERRVRRLYYLAAWLFAAVATMGKGPMGFVIPMICAFAYVATKRRWSELTRLEIISGFLIIGAVALPWYVAMYVRHGPPFTDRLIFHDMFNRALHHVHDTNEGDDTSFRFYVWQLGYGFFPWTGFAPLGLLWWLRRSDSADKAKGDTSVMLFVWFLFSFALFSYMGTKFHHYIAPAVAPAAMLIGVVLDDMLGDGRIARPGRLPMYLAAVGGGVALTVVGLTRFWPGSIAGGKTPRGDLADPSYAVGGGMALAGIAIAIAAAVFFGRKAEENDDARHAHERLVLGAAAIGSALVVALVGRDLILKPEGSDQPGAIRLLQLFTYNYRRPWPESLDFSAALTAFAVAAVVLSLLIVVAPIRRHAVVAFFAMAVAWGVWGTDAYMTKTAPHWGQHELIEAYYRNRRGPEEKLVAYQMNWKGENFYTGNRIPAFVSSGATFTQWLQKEKAAGAKVMYFVTEHGRVGGLKSEVAGQGYKELTDKALCNKFVLVRAEL